MCACVYIRTEIVSRPRTDDCRRPRFLHNNIIVNDMAIFCRARRGYRAGHGDEHGAYKAIRRVTIIMYRAMVVITLYNILYYCYYYKAYALRSLSLCILYFLYAHNILFLTVRKYYSPTLRNIIITFVPFRGDKNSNLNLIYNNNNNKWTVKLVSKFDDFRGSTRSRSQNNITITSKTRAIFSS